MFNSILGDERLLLKVSMLAIMALCGSPVLAQASLVDGTADKSVTAGSGLKLSQPELIREFEASSSQEYTIGAGDEIEVQVPNQTDLQGHHVVGPDGRITLPLVGPMQVSGLTRQAAAESIVKAWRQYYAVIDVTVQVTKYGSNRVVVIGRVASAGPIYFDTAPTLLEVLAKSGAYSARPANGTAPASPAGQTATITRCAIYRGSEQVLWVDMRQLLSGGSAGDLHLRRDDVVYVPDEQEEMVSVLGQVQHPSSVRLTTDTKLLDVLAMAGGLTDNAAPDHIRLVRPATGLSREIALKDLLDPVRARTTEVALERGDVIYVPKSGFSKIGYVLDKLSPAGTLMMFGAIAAGK